MVCRNRVPLPAAKPLDDPSQALTAGGRGYQPALKGHISGTRAFSAQISGTLALPAVHDLGDRTA